MTREARITFSGVSKTYRVRPRPWARARDVSALDGVELELRATEVLAVVGPSGSGKSTLARLAAGIEAPDRGVVRWWSSSGPVAPAARPRFVQLVFQEAGLALDPRRTVKQSVDEPRIVQGLPTEGTARALLERVALDPALLERYPRALSGGQKQRVGLARALALDPEVLVLDEPLASLDTSTAARLLTDLEALRASRGLTVLWVTHDHAAVRSFATRVAVLEAGRVVREGAPAEVLG